MRRRKLSPNYITVNICSSVSTPTKTNVKTPITTPSSTTKTPIRNGQRKTVQEANSQQLSDTRRSRTKLSKTISDSKQSLNTPTTSLKTTPSASPYYLRRRNTKSTIFNMGTMSDSKLERKSQCKF